MTELNTRQVAFLTVMAGLDAEENPGRIFRLAFPDAPFRGRRDAGATRTLDSLERLGFVRGRYPSYGDGRRWRITPAGRKEIE